MSGKVRSRVEVQHRPHCDAVRMVLDGKWSTSWGTPHRTDDVTFRRKNGAKGGYHIWLRLVCNDTKCAGLLLVSLGDVLGLVSP